MENLVQEKLEVKFVTILIFRVIRNKQVIVRTMKRASFEVIFIFVLAIGMVMPYSYYLQISPQKSTNEICEESWSQQEKFIYYAVMVTCTSFIPMMIMIFVYSISMLKLLRFEIPSCDNRRILAKRLKQNNKILKMFGTIVILFFCITTSHMIIHFIVSIYTSFHPEKVYGYNRTFNYAMLISYAFNSFNHCVNPFVYTNKHPSLRKVRKRIFSTITMPRKQETWGIKYETYLKTE